MKKNKFVSLLLAMVMAASLAVPAFAAEDYFTTVSYTSDSTENYRVTVPATLSPGSIGEITVTGSWPKAKSVKITVQSTVTLTNDINERDTKTVKVNLSQSTFPGDNNHQVAAVSSISVSDIENALFGTWSGIITYSIELKTIEMSTIYITEKNKSYSFEVGMTWEEFVNSSYSNGDFYISGNLIALTGTADINYGYDLLLKNNVGRVKSTDVIIVGDSFYAS